jgi:hypothetical protein
MKPRPRKTANLSESIDQQLTMYALAAANPAVRGYGIEAVTWFEYTLSSLLESTAVVT